jgi:hypothetical protein
MPINIEEVLIRVLTDTTKAVNDLNKTDRAVEGVGKSAMSSTKKIALMGAAIGGVSGAVQLVVQGFTSYINKIKEANQAYIDATKENNIHYDTVANTIIALDELKAKAQIEDGKRHSEAMNWWKELRLKRLEATVGQKELNDYIYELWDASVQAAQRTGAAFKSLKKFTEDYKASMVSGTEITDFWQVQKDDMDDIAERTPLVKKSIDDINKANAEYRAQQQADAYSAMMLTAAAIDNEEERRAEAFRIEFAYQQALNAYKEQSHQDELQRIEEELETRKAATVDALTNASSFFGAIGTLASNRYQAEIDAAESGSDKQKELMKKQFNAEKAMSIVQSLIATAVGVTKSIPNIPLMIFSAAQGAIQTAAIAATRPPSFAVGTPPGGYTVPPGYENDSFPVAAASGEKVTVERAGSSSTNVLYANLSIDGYSFGKVITRLFDDRKATIKTRIA